MMKKTHAAIGIAAAISLISYFNVPYISIIGVLGATFPDADLKFGIKHRTITHSILLLFISSAVICCINFEIGFIWFVSYLLHLIADSCTKMGVPFLYPFVKKNYGLKLIKTGEAEDIFIFILAVYLISVLIK